MIRWLMVNWGSRAVIPARLQLGTPQERYKRPPLSFRLRPVISEAFSGGSAGGHFTAPPTLNTECPRAGGAKYHKLHGLNNRSVSRLSAGSQNYELKVALRRAGPSEAVGNGSGPGLSLRLGDGRLLSLSLLKNFLKFYIGV